MLIDVVEDCLPRLFVILERIGLPKVLVLKQSVDEVDPSSVTYDQLLSIIDEGTIESRYNVKIEKKNRGKEGWVAVSAKRVSETVTDIVESTFGSSTSSSILNTFEVETLPDILNQFTLGKTISLEFTAMIALRFLRIGINIWRKNMKPSLKNIDLFDIVVSLVRRPNEQNSTEQNTIEPERNRLLIDSLLGGYTELLEIMSSILSKKLGSDDLAVNLEKINRVHVPRLKHLYSLKSFSVHERTW